MKTISLIALAVLAGLPAAAQEKGMCATECRFVGTSDGSVNGICRYEDMGQFLTNQKYPNKVLEDPGAFAVEFSRRNPELGINVAIPGGARLFYPCGLPLK